MEEFVAKHILGIFLTQLAIGISAIVKLWFNFQTLKRDFEKKEKSDEKIIDKGEAAVIKAIENLDKKFSKEYEKLEMKSDVNASSIEKFKEEIRVDMMAIRDSLTKVLVKQDMQNEKLNQLELSTIRFKLDSDRKNV